VTLSIVVPHWPLDGEVDEALRRCLASLPDDCEPGIEPGGFHGAFWVAPRDVIQRVGLLDERFEGAFFEDDDYLERLRQAGVPTLCVESVRARSHRVGLTMSKVQRQADAWYAENERRFTEKWGWTPPPL
jgi:GT2 family glycosyltransferase